MKDKNARLASQVKKMLAKQRFAKEILLKTTEVKLTYEKVIQRALEDHVVKAKVQSLIDIEFENQSAMRQLREGGLISNREALSPMKKYPRSPQ